MRRRFLVPSIEGDSAILRGAAAHHLATVLRAAPGERIELACAGRAYLARVAAVMPLEVRFAVEAEIAVPAMSGVTLAAALFKFDRFEWMLEKATELGVDAIVPLVSRRTQAHLAAAAPQRQARWLRLLQSASQQARRAETPRLEAARSVMEFVAQPRTSTGLLLDETGGEAWPSWLGPPATLLIGPEGGWAGGEVEAIAAAGFERAGLGPRILRCETAAIAALTMLVVRITLPG